VGLAVEHFARGFTLAELLGVLDIRGVLFKTQLCVVDFLFPKTLNV